jgi:hypothetical protein
MLTLTRRVLKICRSPVPDDMALEPLIIDACKADLHLVDVLSGLA